MADLTLLVDEEPLRERPRALLMATLADAGRVAEALRVSTVSAGYWVRSWASNLASVGCPTR